MESTSVSWWEGFLKWLAAAAGAIAGFFGGWNMLLTVLVIVMSLDYITGLVVAWRGRSPKSSNGGLSSKAGFDGLIKKAFIMLIVLLATMVDRVAGNSTFVFQTATASYYIANEGLSVLENVGLMGVDIPTVLKKALDLLKEKSDKNEPPDVQV